ncbi:unnamed protein product [Amoebophrya sp. A120]|nr:unnamed protein product [Amoebophrya sp. A120]|eukprot:GSA120T00023540001.1
MYSAGAWNSNSDGEDDKNRLFRQAVKAFDREKKPLAPGAVVLTSRNTTKADLDEDEPRWRRTTPPLLEQSSSGGGKKGAVTLKRAPGGGGGNASGGGTSRTVQLLGNNNNTSNNSNKEGGSASNNPVILRENADYLRDRGADRENSASGDANGRVTLVPAIHIRQQNEQEDNKQQKVVLLSKRDRMARISNDKRVSPNLSNDMHPAVNLRRAVTSSPEEDFQRLRAGGIPTLITRGPSRGGTPLKREGVEREVGTTNTTIVTRRGAGGGTTTGNKDSRNSGFILSPNPNGAARRAAEREQRELKNHLNLKTSRDIEDHRSDGESSRNDGMKVTTTNGPAAGNETKMKLTTRSAKQARSAGRAAGVVVSSANYIPVVKEIEIPSDRSASSLDSSSPSSSKSKSSEMRERGPRVVQSQRGTTTGGGKKNALDNHKPVSSTVAAVNKKTKNTASEPLVETNKASNNRSGANIKTSTHQQDKEHQHQGRGHNKALNTTTTSTKNGPTTSGTAQKQQSRADSRSKNFEQRTTTTRGGNKTRTTAREEPVTRKQVNSRGPGAEQRGNKRKPSPQSYEESDLSSSASERGRATTRNGNYNKQAPRTRAVEQKEKSRGRGERGQDRGQDRDHLKEASPPARGSGGTTRDRNNNHDSGTNKYAGAKNSAAGAKNSAATTTRTGATGDRDRNKTENNRTAEPQRSARGTAGRDREINAGKSEREIRTREGGARGGNAREDRTSAREENARNITGRTAKEAPSTAPPAQKRPATTKTGSNNAPPQKKPRQQLSSTERGKTAKRRRQQQQASSSSSSQSSDSGSSSSSDSGSSG